MANSPAIGEVDLTKIPEDVVTIGLNRILARYMPDYILIVDKSVEPKYHPTEGALRGGLLTIGSTPYVRRSDAIVMKRGKSKTTQHPPWVWPKSFSDPLIMAGNSACYAFQWALLTGAREIAVIGLDYTHKMLRDKGEQTHFYGKNPINQKLECDINGVQKQFWLEAAARANCIDLSPYDGTPFQWHCQWPRESWESYCSR